jgi:predicted nucleic acid-binding protein
MKAFLPDVNTLLAMLDPMHSHHESAHRWYAARKRPRLLLCSHVVNGVIRVASQPRYPNPLGTCARVRESLKSVVERVDSAFCQRDASLLEDRILKHPDELTPSRVGDLYLLALAVANGAKFATFDTRIPADAIAGGSGALELIPVLK